MDRIDLYNTRARILYDLNGKYPTCAINQVAIRYDLVFMFIDTTVPAIIQPCTYTARLLGKVKPRQSSNIPPNIA
jgi:hypothetical protein